MLEVQGFRALVYGLRVWDLLDSGSYMGVSENRGP